MNKSKTSAQDSKRYLTSIGAWSLAFGGAVGWGSFVMPGTTFLPLAGPVGTALGITLGGLVMLILAVNYHYLMNCFPDGGGAYTYTKLSWGYDHGFLGAWFLILTYIAIIWANATALPIIVRTIFGSVFQFGFLYEIAEYKIYTGEILLSVAALLFSAFICLSKKISQRIQILMAMILFLGIIVCFAAALGKVNVTDAFTPAFSKNKSALSGTFTIFALAPWAFVGFESISHSAKETVFPLKRSFAIMAVAVITSCIAYSLLSLLAVTVLPQGYTSWESYIEDLGTFEGIASQPTFHAAYKTLGNAGKYILGTAAFGAIITGLISNYVALSRLISNMSEDGMIPKRIGAAAKNNVPRNAILTILGISIILPFFGRTAISWIVDVTTVGATGAYALASASAWKTARRENNKKMIGFGITGIIISLLFALEFLIPNLIDITTLSTESYLILSLWSISGFVYFRIFLQKDKERRLGRSLVAWVVLLGLIIFTSSVWMRQTIDNSQKQSVENSTYYLNKALRNTDDSISTTTVSFIRDELDSVNKTIDMASFIQICLIIVSLIILLNIYSIIMKREKQTEVEKIIAEENSRAKTSFLSNMSHEIRTPMNAIIVLDNIALKNPDLAPETRDQLEKIGSSANHLLGLINDILDMSRIESGKMVLKHEEFSFKEFLDQINIMINGQCLDKGLEYECSIIGEVNERYIGDGMKLKQVLINILGNSVKFTPTPGKVSLTVEQIAKFDGYCTLRFIAKDTGIGMSKEYIPKIFEAFSQEKSHDANKYVSTGLGMAITKNIVTMMNGDIEVESEKGKGTTFTVTVTLTEASSAVISADTQNLIDPAGNTDLAGKRVLIAEDIDINAEILIALLEMEEIDSEHAENGKIAVEMFTNNPEGYYDAILMDMQMPVMDGLTASRAIRDIDRGDAKTIPIIALTANAFDEDVQKSLQAGLNAHLYKPIEPDKLFGTLKKLIH